MRRWKQDGGNGRLGVGLGGVLLVAAGAALVAMAAFSTDATSRVSIAEASHNTYPVGTLENSVKVTICHTEGNGTQHSIEIAAAALITAGHFDAPGNPLHAVGAVHDFIISIEGIGVINDDACGAATATAVVSTNTPTATLPVATSTQQAEATSTATNTPTNTVAPSTNTPTNTPTNTAVLSTNTPTATLPVATSTQQAEATSTATNTPTNTVVPSTNTPTNTPTNTAVPSTNTPTNTPTNTAVPSTNTPTATADLLAEIQAAQATPPPQVRGVQATPPPTVRTLPATGSGGDGSDNTILVVGLAMMLAGSTISLVSMRRRAE